MDDATGAAQGEMSQVSPSDAKTAHLKERLEKLLREAAEVEVELSRADGSIKGVPHYSVIEERAHELGRKLSRQVQQRQIREAVASQPLPATWRSGDDAREEPAHIAFSRISRSDSSDSVTGL